MTLATDVQPMEAIGAIARRRYMLLKRADEILGNRSDISVAEHADTLPNVSALLMTALEELKVAEEELRVQNATLEAQRAMVDERARHYRQLFMYSPAPTFVTDVYGTIQEANLAAATLFRREARHLERKQLVALLSAEYRDEFRRQLPRVSVGEGVRDWRLVFRRLGDVPLEARASVRLVPEIGATGSGVLYWMLSVADRAD